MAATRDHWIVVAKRVVFEHHDNDSEGRGDFMGRVAEVVHKEQKNWHVPKESDRIFVKIQRNLIRSS